MVSICIPTYNNVKLFKRCLDSVLMQDFKNYEIVVSDDSTNNEVHEYIKTLDILNLRYYRNTPALGTPLNWNNAMNLAKGEYIKILHHDDYFTTAASLGKFVNSLDSDPEADFSFSYSSIHFKKENDFFLHKQTLTQKNRLKKDPRFLFFRNIIGAPSATFFRKDNGVMFNEHYKWLVDVEFYMRYLKKHKLFVSIPEALVMVVDGEEDQVTQSVSKNKKLVIRENLDLFSSVYSEDLNTAKVYVFFQELFVQFDILSFKQLRDEFKIPANLEIFLDKVFKDLSKNKLIKAIKKRVLTSRYNKRIFKIERF